MVKRLVCRLAIFIFFAAAWLALPSAVQAQECCGSGACYDENCGGDANCTSVCLNVGNPCPDVYGSCYTTWYSGDWCWGGWTDWSSCQGGYETRTCPASGALQIRACGGGGGGQCNSSHFVNCPGTETRTDEIIGTQCVRTLNLDRCQGRLGASVGTAQTVGGCCEEGDDPDTGERVCISNTVYTHSCFGCPPGQEVSNCGYRPTGGYSYFVYDPRWYSQYHSSCQNPGDIFIGTVPTPQTVENRAYWTCNNCGEEGEEWFWVYKTTNQCHQTQYACDCVLTCTVTAPPSNLQVTPGADYSRATLTWQPSSGGIVGSRV